MATAAAAAPGDDNDDDQLAGWKSPILQAGQRLTVPPASSHNDLLGIVVTNLGVAEETAAAVGNAAGLLATG